jgi:gamma-glutamylcyclotransferase (GGCT)/AIG2-like uncharacterized protein YtfP
MDPLQMKKRCPGATYIGTAQLPNHELSFGGFSFSRGGAVATIRRQKGSVVPGILWKIPDHEVAILDRYEGAPYQYKRRQVRAFLMGPKKIELTMETYFLCEETEGDPTPAYWQQIRAVYVRHGWDCSHLESFAKGEHEVFVYGTLRRGASNHHKLGHASFVCEVVTAPKYSLLHLGAFPGLVRGKDKVVGEVWRTTGLGLAELDIFEGCPVLYDREKIHLENGSEVWGYTFQRSVKGLPKIPGGDWMKALPIL